MINKEYYADFFEKNRKAWNKKTPYHLESEFYNINKFKQGHSSLYQIELIELKEVANKDLLHLQCHFGLDTISWSRLGANCTGVDFSEVAINAAINLNKVTKSNCHFVNSNIYDINLSGAKYDIIYCSYGAINWLPDLKEWGRIISSYLKPNGIFYIVDFHPLLIAHDCLEEQHLSISYFNQKDPIRKIYKGTYTNFSAPIESEEYTWNHSISEIINALSRNSLEIIFFNEHSYLPFNCFSNLVLGQDGNWRVKGFEDIFPVCFSLKAIKKDYGT